jgi:hypothetical protein
MRVLLVAVLLAGITACGGGGSKYDSAEAVAKALGCDSSWKADAAGDMEMFVADSGECSINGDTPTINWFKDSTSIDNWTRAASAVGGGYMLVGGNFTIENASKATLTQAQGLVGGTVK